MDRMDLKVNQFWILRAAVCLPLLLPLLQLYNGILDAESRILELEVQYL